MLINRRLFDEQRVYWNLRLQQRPTHTTVCVGVVSKVSCSKYTLPKEVKANLIAI